MEADDDLIVNLIRQVVDLTKRVEKLETMHNISRPFGSGIYGKGNYSNG